MNFAFPPIMHNLRRLFTKQEHPALQEWTANRFKTPPGICKTVKPTLIIRDPVQLKRFWNAEERMSHNRT